MNVNIGDVYKDAIGKFMVAIQILDGDVIWQVIGVRKPQPVPKRFLEQDLESNNGIFFSDNRITVKVNNSYFWLHYQPSSLVRIRLSSDFELRYFGHTFPSNVNQLENIDNQIQGNEKSVVNWFKTDPVSKKNRNPGIIKAAYRTGSVYMTEQGEYLIALNVEGNNIIWHKIFAKGYGPNQNSRMVVNNEDGKYMFRYSDSRNDVRITDRNCRYRYFGWVKNSDLKPLLSHFSDMLKNPSPAAEKRKNQAVFTEFSLGDVSYSNSHGYMLAIQQRGDSIVWKRLKTKIEQQYNVQPITIETADKKIDLYYKTSLKMQIITPKKNMFSFVGKASTEITRKILFEYLQQLEDKQLTHEDKKPVDLAARPKAKKTKAAAVKIDQPITSRKLSKREIDPLTKLDIYKKMWAYLPHEQIQRPSVPQINLSHEVINIQQVYEILREYPDIASDFIVDDRLPFNNCTLIFKDTTGKVVLITGTNSDDGVVFETMEGFNYDALCRLAVSLMNCRNVSYEEYDPNQQTSSVVNPASPLIKYKILHIRPFRNGKVNQQISEQKEGRLRPARAVRGHYMIGSVERPLFGKPWGVGRFWVGPHFTGNIKHGLVIKDYHIELKDLKQRIEENLG